MVQLEAVRWGKRTASESPGLGGDTPRLSTPVPGTSRRHRARRRGIGGLLDHNLVGESALLAQGAPQYLIIVDQENLTPCA